MDRSGSSGGGHSNGTGGAPHQPPMLGTIPRRKSNTNSGGTTGSNNLAIPRRSLPPVAGQPPSGPASGGASLPQKKVKHKKLSGGSLYSHQQQQPPPISSSSKSHHQFHNRDGGTSSTSSHMMREGSSSSHHSIPKKSSFARASPPPLQEHQQEELPPPSFAIPRRTAASKSSYVTVKSEHPFIIRVKLSAGIPMDKGGIPRLRLSARAPKRKRTTYQEATLTDSDDFMSEAEEEEFERKRLKKKGSSKKRASSSSTPAAVNGGTGTSDTGVSKSGIDTPDNLSTAVADSAVVPATTDAVDAPPPGTLASLWYSRESLLHVFVIEKILGWKTRPVVKLNFRKDGDNAIPAYDVLEAAELSGKILTQSEFWNDPRKRMDVSRINGAHCPVVLPIAAAREETLAAKNGKQPRFTLAPQESDKEVREEVLLVKWRGRSYVHCSWERRKDLERLDPSNNTARHKIRRYIANQETIFGKNWKNVLEEDRLGVPDLHADHVPGEKRKDESNAGPSEEEFYPPDYTEVERILACDENEMDMKVLARQRALNIQEDQNTLNKREEEAKLSEAQVDGKTDGEHDDKDKISSLTATERTRKALALSTTKELIDAEEKPWDPEDNVRYVVKWKGLQYSEITWEYWRDIKADAVDQAEDFWHRQKPPSTKEVEAIMKKPHPHVRDFRKLAKSPEFAISKRERPVADLGNGNIQENKKDDDEEETSVGFRLRGYQLEGVNWLLFNWWNRRSCILADEMGLGKTIQTVGFLHQLHELQATSIRGPFLVVAPLSLIGQWQSESHTWAPDMHTLFYHGSADARDFLAKQEFYYTDQFVPKQTAVKLKKQHITKFHILITTYEVILKDINVLSKIRWKALVVDEAHRLKNPKARLFEELASVPRDFCLLLTGTPLQNSTEELWALLHFSDPVAFASRDEFVDKFGQLTDSKQVSDLHTMLKPYLLRRVKEDVEKSLPPKEETILEVSLTPIQKTFYKAIYERNTAFLYKGSKPSNAPSLMNVMMELRKCCNHPFLVRGAEDRILLDAANALKNQKDENGNEMVIDYIKLFCEHLVKSSGKMVLLEKLLPKLQSGGHKVLIFSQMVRVLDLLEELLKVKRYRYERLDGSTSASARSAAVQRFGRKSMQRFVMLLSTRAGGLGLNLTAADTVIIFDSDWNPQNDLQAMARAHRIGQTRAVRVYRLLTSKTYEMHMFHSASMKLGLDRAMLAQQRQQDGDGTENKNKGKNDRQIQAKEIDELLKKGAYDVFRDDDDTEAKQFMDTDIDQLLERNSKKVTYGNTDTSLSSGLGSFSKASFVADTGDGGKDVDLDDPDFWEKAVGLDAPPAETPEDVAQMLDDGVKRSRKQVQVFDPYAAFAEAEQKKKDKIEQKAKAEKAEKQRLRLEKKKRKMEEKERKRRERDEARGRLFGQSKVVQLAEEVETEEEKISSGKAKKIRKSERRKALKRAQNEDPIMERLKQAWEVPQRNRATSAALRFGFHRFCKIRNESNLTSLPIQDLEVFFRSYIYQLSLQAAVSLLSLLKSKLTTDSDIVGSIDGSFRPLIKHWLGLRRDEEADWFCESICSAIQFQREVNARQRPLRMPFILAEPSYVAELRNGAAFRSLRRIGVLCRLNCFVETALDSILADIGPEELGKRGCTTRDISSLDIDLKSRHVTAEELHMAIGAQLRTLNVQHRPPAVWWDRSCDIGLIIGTFVHGFGNYEAMRNDEDLPFAERIRRYAKNDDHCTRAYQCFDAATNAARKVFDDALESAKLRAQEEAHRAVAAAVAASKRPDAKDPTASFTDDKNTPSKEESKESPKDEPESVLSEEDNSKETMTDEPTSVPSNPEIGKEMPTEDDTHLVTLMRLRRSMVDAVQAKAGALQKTKKIKEDENGEKGEANKENDTEDDALPLHQHLPLPDARVLDGLLQFLLLGGPTKSHEALPKEIIEWKSSPGVAEHEKIQQETLARMFAAHGASEDEDIAYRGIGFSGTQCASNHRSLDDGSDFCVGSASSELSHVASGNDAPRYLRAIGVPMNVTRYCVSSLIYADEPVVARVLATEKRYEATKEDATLESSSTGMNLNDTPQEKPDAALSNSDVEEKIVIPPVLSGNARLRASICSVALYFGLPRSQNRSVSQEILLQMSRVSSEELFSTESFLKTSCSLAVASDMPDIKSFYQYIDDVFLPHCLRLAIKGNGPTNREGRASKGQYETAFGVSLNAENAGHQLSPLPDPALPLADHSPEAVASASAIIRRHRMMRSAQFIVGGGVSWEDMNGILRGANMLKDMSGLPIWWCPWIHDLALLVHASTFGLFSILMDLQNATKLEGTAFDCKEIEKHVRSTFVTNNALPRKFLDNMKSSDVDDWVKSQTKQFPSMNVIERRLALVCSQLTGKTDSEQRYDNMPMFDHGGWPRN